MFMNILIHYICILYGLDIDLMYIHSMDFLQKNAWLKLFNIERILSFFWYDFFNSWSRGRNSFHILVSTSGSTRTIIIIITLCLCTYLACSDLVLGYLSMITNKVCFSFVFSFCSLLFFVFFFLYLSWSSVSFALGVWIRFFWCKSSFFFRFGMRTPVRSILRLSFPFGCLALVLFV